MFQNFITFILCIQWSLNYRNVQLLEYFFFFLSVPYLTVLAIRVVFPAQGVGRGIIAWEKRPPRHRDSNSSFLLAKYCIIQLGHPALTYKLLIGIVKIIIFNKIERKRKLFFPEHRLGKVSLISRNYIEL